MMEWDREDSSLTPVLPVLRALLACATSSRMLSARDTSTCARCETITWLQMQSSWFQKHGTE